MIKIYSTLIKALHKVGANYLIKQIIKAYEMPIWSSSQGTPDPTQTPQLKRNVRDSNKSYSYPGQPLDVQYLLYTKNKKLARKVANVLGYYKLNSGRASSKEAEEITEMLQLEQDPTLRIAAGQQAIIQALTEIIVSFKQQDINPELIIKQREKIDKEVQRTQNLIRSLLSST
jgi:hypothetical protein